MRFIEREDLGGLFSQGNDQFLVNVAQERSKDIVVSGISIDSFSIRFSLRISYEALNGLDSEYNNMYRWLEELKDQAAKMIISVSESSERIKEITFITKQENRSFRIKP